MVSLSALVSLGLTYLLLLFGVAYLTEKGIIPKQVSRHPIVHLLSIGVYASVWSFYGSLELAAQSGYLYLASYLGAVVTFLLAPAVLIPVLRLTRSYQLSSLADLFAFRFRSGLIGAVTTLLLFVCMLPMISIQLQTVADALHQLNSRFSSSQISLVFCLVLALFSLLFGARHASLRDKHDGLVMAMATESVIKIIAVTAMAFFSMFQIFSGPGELADWLNAHPIYLETLQQPVNSDVWRTMLIGFFGAAMVMPHMFHMMFTENSQEETLYRASWAMPLLLFVMAAAVPPIIWACAKLGATSFGGLLALQLGELARSPLMIIVAFIGGLSAASGITIVGTVAVASMVQNHLLLPLIPDTSRRSVISRVIWLRRALIIAMLLTAYLFYRYIGHLHSLHQLGIIAIMAFMQFLPGLLATIFWQNAHKNGVLAGLIGGIATWSLSLFSPFLEMSDSLEILQGGHWETLAINSLVLNTALMIIISLLSRQTPEERQAAHTCLLNALNRITGDQLNATTPDDFLELLTPRLGATLARRELERATRTLGLDHSRLQPIDLIRLRNQLEQNLCAIIGPIEAAALLSHADQRQSGSGRHGYGTSQQTHILEAQLENYQERLTGLAAELNRLRRLHRDTLQRMPTGVCTVDANNLIAFWNSEASRITGIPEQSAIGNNISRLPAPWCTVLEEFAHSNRLHESAQSITTTHGQIWISLHKAPLSSERYMGLVLLIEDETEHQTFQQRMAHTERLSSIGRFAAGIAHEIGNPVTGIACLAQNLKLETDDPEILETGDQIVLLTRRINEIVQSLIRFAHSGQTGPSSDTHVPFSLEPLIEEAVSLVSLDSRGKHQHFIVEGDPQAETEGNPQQILQVLVNLLNNACDASEYGGRIWIRVEQQEASLELSVTDEGSGIPEALQDRLFEPFFTTKEPGSGTGLGLALVYNIIREHYGSIEVLSPATNKQNKGTRVLITLPAIYRQNQAPV